LELPGYYNPDKDSDTTRLGSPGYAAPEQYRDRGQSSPQSDIYALGVILFQMITKYDPTVTPFKFPPIKKFFPHFSEDLDNIIQKAIQKDPMNRYLSMRDFKEALSDYIQIKKDFPLPVRSSPYKPNSPSFGYIADDWYILLSIPFTLFCIIFPFFLKPLGLAGFFLWIMLICLSLVFPVRGLIKDISLGRTICNLFFVLILFISLILFIIYIYIYYALPE